MSSFPQPSAENDYLVEHANLMRTSLKRLAGKDLVDPTLSAVEAAKAIYEAPFVVVSHDRAADPVFTYANKTALELFEMSWSEFTALPSRKSAELPNREERAQLLEAVSTQGFIANYSGNRISKNGNRFAIEQVTVWNLIDDQDTYWGQAATWPHWRYL